MNNSCTSITLEIITILSRAFPHKYGTFVLIIIHTRLLTFIFSFISLIINFQKKKSFQKLSRHLFGEPFSELFKPSFPFIFSLSWWNIQSAPFSDVAAITARVHKLRQNLITSSIAWFSYFLWLYLFKFSLNATTWIAKININFQTNRCKIIVYKG